MKKTYNLILAALASMAISANAQASDPTCLWANNFSYANADGAGITNIGYNIALASDGNLLIFNDCGTTSSTQQVLFGDDVVGIGTDYASTSYNHGLFLVKADSETGKTLWSVYTSVGESSSNQGAVVPTSDGGAYLVAKVRPTWGRGTEQINFVDATGANNPIDWVLESDDAKRYYNGLIVKINAQGAFQWYRLITMNHDPQPAATYYTEYTSEGIYIQTAVADDDDNLYVGGRFCTAMTFDNGVTLTPKSVEGWNGDPQSTCGDLFIAKFDPQGNYVSSLVQEGVADAAQIFNLKYDDGTLYAAGYLDGIEGNSYSLGGVDLTAANTSKDLLVANIDTELNVNWAKLYANSYGGGIFNKLTINPIGDNLWITSKARVYLSDGQGHEINCSSKTRDGLLLRLNKADGQWLGATTYGTNQAGFNGVFESKDENAVYVYGHVLLGNLFLAKYNIADLTMESQWNLHNVASDLQNISIVASDKRIYTMARASKGTCTVYSADGNRTLTQSNGFNTVVCAFELPVDINTAITEVADSQMQVYAADGMLHVVTDRTSEVRVYNLMGAQVATIHAMQGDNAISLPTGIYIAGGKKLIVR